MKSFALAVIILGMILLLPLFIVLIKLFVKWLWEACRNVDQLVDSESPYLAAVLIGVAFLVMGVMLLAAHYDDIDNETRAIQQTQQENSNGIQKQEASTAAALSEVQQ